MYVSCPHKKIQTIGGSREKCIDSKWSFGGSKMPIPLQKSRWVNAKKKPKISGSQIEIIFGT